LLDEAYVDFVDPALGFDTVSLIERHNNLVLSRSFSKGYSLAGLRFGYGLGQAALIAPVLHKTRDVYNVDVIAQRLATAALEDRAYAADAWRKVRAERERMAGALAERGFAPLDSQTNFRLARAPEGQGAGALQRGLEQAGILVRHFDTERLRDHLRITIGTPDENAALLVALDALL
jgi:histidinol-phosphate aminotransferase